MTAEREPDEAGPAPGRTARASAPPGVLGLGLVGGSLLQALGAAGAEPVGWDADSRVTGAAVRAGFAVADGPAALARTCGVVVVCVPPERTAATVADALAADPEAIVADAASVKSPVLEAVAERAGETALRRYVPAHPLAGSERRGWDAAAPDLLRAALWAVCPVSADAPVEPLCALSALLDPLDARLLVCDAEAHDAAVARTSHVPHVVAQALARAPSSALAAALTGGAYRDMTRTATADARLWSAILLANRQPAAAALRELVGELGALADALATGDDAALATAWTEGAGARERVEALRWSEPSWTAESVSGPGWDALLEHGHAGRAVRRLRMAGGVLDLEVAA